MILQHLTESYLDLYNKVKDTERTAYRPQHCLTYCMLVWICPHWINLIQLLQLNIGWFKRKESRYMERSQSNKSDSRVYSRKWMSFTTEIIHWSLNLDIFIQTLSPKRVNFIMFTSNKNKLRWKFKHFPKIFFHLSLISQILRNFKEIREIEEMLKSLRNLFLKIRPCCDLFHRFGRASKSKISHGSANVVVSIRKKKSSYRRERT